MQEHPPTWQNQIIDDMTSLTVSCSKTGDSEQSLLHLGKRRGPATDMDYFMALAYTGAGPNPGSRSRPQSPHRAGDRVP